MDRQGRLRSEGIQRVVRAVGQALDSARDQRVSELIPVATATIRDAVNRDEIVAAVERQTGVRVGFLTGEEAVLDEHRRARRRPRR